MCFELIDLLLGHLVARVVENFFGEHFEDVEVVFADVHVLDGGGADVVDEAAPGGVPFVLYDLHEG